MNEWLAAAPSAELMHGMVGCRVSVSDMADRPPRVLSNGEVVDIGGRRLRYIDTPHVPHGWDAGVMFEETTQTLLCGDLFTRVGNSPAITDGDVVEPTIETEDLFHYTSLGPSTGSTIRKLADLRPKVLAAMHGARWGRCAEGPGRSLRGSSANVASDLIGRMSAFGTKRTSESTQPMSAFGGKADIAQTRLNVRF